MRAYPDPRASGRVETSEGTRRYPEEHGMAEALLFGASVIPSFPRFWGCQDGFGRVPSEEVLGALGLQFKAPAMIWKPDLKSHAQKRIAPQ